MPFNLTFASNAARSLGGISARLVYSTVVLPNGFFTLIKAIDTCSGNSEMAGGVTGSELMNCKLGINGDVYVQNTIFNPNLYYPPGYTTSFVKSGSVLNIMKFSTTGSLIWINRYNRPCYSNSDNIQCEGNGMAIASDDTTYHGGYGFNSGANPSFITAINSSGSVLWSSTNWKYMSSHTGLYGCDLAVGPDHLWFYSDVNNSPSTVNIIQFDRYNGNIIQNGECWQTGGGSYSSTTALFSYSRGSNTWNIDSSGTVLYRLNWTTSKTWVFTILNTSSSIGAPAFNQVVKYTQTTGPLSDYAFVTNTDPQILRFTDGTFITSWPTAKIQGGSYNATSTLVKISNTGTTIWGKVLTNLYDINHIGIDGGGSILMWAYASSGSIVNTPIFLKFDSSNGSVIGMMDCLMSYTTGYTVGAFQLVQRAFNVVPHSGASGGFHVSGNAMVMSANGGVQQSANSIQLILKLPTDFSLVTGLSTKTTTGGETIQFFSRTLADKNIVVSDYSLPNSFYSSNAYTITFNGADIQRRLKSSSEASRYGTPYLATSQLLTNFSPNGVKIL